MSICGTPGGYKRHRNLKEQQCDACQKDYRMRRRVREGLPAESPMNATELIAEIERLLSYGEGEYAIVRAVGYADKINGLKARLYENGRSDLNARIFYSETLAA